jgi:hypothetical protein
MGGLSKEAQRHVQVGAAKWLRLRSTKTKAITATFAASLVRYKLLPRSKPPSVSDLHPFHSAL